MTNRRVPKFLVDTNVWLDNYLGSRGGCAESRRFIDEATACRAPLLHAATSAKDVYFFTGKLAKARMRAQGHPITEADALAIKRLAWAHVRNMGEISTAVGIGLAELWLAEKYSAFNDDLEDNLIMAAAETAGADYIVTRDRELIRRSTVSALVPEDAVDLLRCFR